MVYIYIFITKVGYIIDIKQRQRFGDRENTMLTILYSQQHRDSPLTETSYARTSQGRLQKIETEGFRKLGVNREARVVLKKSNQDS